MGLRVSGWGSVSGMVLRFRAQGLAFRVRVMVEDLGFWVWNLGFGG
jgi:hypothetical protein